MATGGSFTVLGGVSATVAAARGLSGVVTDGAVRDVEEISACGLPVRYGTTSPRSCRGEYQVIAVGKPVAFGAATVRPGDLVVADRDGVVAVPADVAQVVLARAREIERIETIWTELAGARGSISDGYAEVSRTVGSPHRELF